jgi:hypothetical protein
MARTLLVVGAAMAALFVVLAGPASAQFEPATLDVEFECDDSAGEWVITFVLDSPDLGGTTLFDVLLEAEASPETELDITPFPTQIDAGETGTATITLDGTYNGNIDWTVTYQEGGQDVPNEGNVELGEECVAPTTTTEAPTTTTTAPPAVAVAVTPTFTG